MHWETHLREMAQTAKEHPEYKMLSWFTAESAVKEIDSLREKLQAAEALAARYREILEGMEFGNLDALKNETRNCRIIGEAAKKAILDKDVEILNLTALASRLVDQEAIEKHTRRVTAEEIVGIVKRFYEDKHSVCCTETVKQCHACLIKEIRSKFGEGK